MGECLPQQDFIRRGEAEEDDDEELDIGSLRAFFYAEIKGRRADRLARACLSPREDLHLKEKASFFSSGLGGAGLFGSSVDLLFAVCSVTKIQNSNIVPQLDAS